MWRAYSSMRIILFITLLLILSIIPQISAQNTLEEGDPPIKSLIDISPPDGTGLVTITGNAGSVFPAAQVSVRNLYTGETVYVGAGITGSFVATIHGTGNTPYWISPASTIPAELRGQSGSLAGGAGTIIYGVASESTTEQVAITPFTLDGQFNDWIDYDIAVLDDTLALRNQDSLYLGIREAIPIGAQFAVLLTVDNLSYEVVFDPRLPQSAILRQIAPTTLDLGTIVVAVAINEAGTHTEVRLPIPDNNDVVESATLDQIVIRTDGGEELSVVIINADIPFVDEQDGIVYPNRRLQGNGITRFSVSGALAGRSSTWSARGRANDISLSAGETLTVELDVTLNVPEFPESLSGLQIIGVMGLQPIAIDTDGDGTAEQPIVGQHSNNGWSNLRTPSGLALDNMQGDLTLGMVTVDAGQVIRREGKLLAGLRFDLILPDDLPDGVYVPTFEGFAQVGDGEIFAWTDNGVFGTGETFVREDITRLPIILNVGRITTTQLPMPLFYEQPSDGSRGILAEEDHGRIALSNRTRFDSQSYILPPNVYSIEPYLLNQLTNAYDYATAPLIPLLLPGGRMIATVTRPDGTVDEFPSTPLAQNILSTPTIDERDRYGAQSPVDVYHLTTLNSSFTDYIFDDYGDYQIEIFTTLEDIWGNRYSGGGLYHLTIAEPLDLTPDVLSGTPFTVGDSFYAGLHLAPRVPADVSVTMQVYPLDGSEMIETHIEGQASQQGVFIPELDSPITFDILGEYIVDYEARYSDSEGRVWASSFRSAGVIGNAASPLILHGRRGLEDYRIDPPAWFTTANYPPPQVLESPLPRLHYPYFAGDVAYIADSPNVGIRPVLQVQDLEGRYRSWLNGSVANYIAPTGDSLTRLGAIGALPLLSVLGGVPSPYSPALIPELVVNNAYAYISATRPDVTVRQFVQGADSPALMVNWDNDDTLNRQIGTGQLGNSEGDYIFLFGGAVVRNPEAGIQDVAVYASLAIVTDAESESGVYPPYSGSAGGADGGALLTVRNEGVDMFFHPTSIHAGEVLTLGDTLAIAGQVAPTLHSQVQVTITVPDGTQRTFDGMTNAIGYFYQPEFDFTLDQTGIWIVDITTRPMGVTSAGEPQAPLPRGGVLGEVNSQFKVFVLPTDSTPLSWNQGSDIELTRSNPAGAFNIIIDVPSEWTDTQAYYVMTTPSYILADATIQIFAETATYQYSPPLIAREFANIEGNAGVGDNSFSDVVTLTFVVTGIDENGDSAIRSRTFTFLHDRITSFEGVVTETD